MPLFNNETASLLRKKLSAIFEAEHSYANKLNRLSRLFELLFEKASEETDIKFTTLFSRMSFVSTRYNLPSQLNYLLHQYRRSLMGELFEEQAIIATIDLGRYSINWTLDILTGEEFETSSNHDSFMSLWGWGRSKVEYERHYKILRGLITEIDLEDNSFLFSDYEKLFDRVKISLEKLRNETDKQAFLRSISDTIKLPFQINLLDAKLSEKQVLYPEALVLEPNFLVNITSVAEGFKHNGKCTELSYLLRKFVPIGNSIPLLKGNIVNFFLDELINNPDQSFKDLLPQVFTLFPMKFLSITDIELKNLIADLKQHYNNLKRAVNNEFVALGINKDQVYLEPSFYAPDYGFQGRLDLFHINEKNAQVDIIELKSGKVFRPNVYKISSNHFVQTLLYGLLIEKIIKRSRKPSLYILYSNEEKEALRFAPTIRDKQLEAVHERNKIILREKSLLQDISREEFNFFNMLDPANLDRVDNFIKRDAVIFWKAYSRLDELELKYFNSFIQFISIEYHLSKTGEHGINKANGLAGIWLDSLQEKLDDFSILCYLNIKHDKSTQVYPTIEFEFSERTNSLSKFRKGDIAVIYPYYGSREAVLEHQIFKCNIVDIDSNSVKVKLRYQQKTSNYFERYKFWNIEYDMLDSSYNSSFKGMFNFISADKEKRALILSRKAPRKGVTREKEIRDELTTEQSEIITKILASQDYFLLWGPPGTGKTSFMLRHLVSELYFNSKENILLLSFTNRSVDEICAAVSQIEADFDNYIRIGSRLSVADEYKGQLLVNKINQISSRKALIEMIEKNRVFVATVASIANNNELFELKNFDTIIIDEASQILEPSLVGILPKTKRFIMIGDHKQLPAVVVQNEAGSKINDEQLIEKIGLTDRRVSLFERLYTRCVKNNWNWAFGILSKQGRMHKEIMNFSNVEFYENKLDVLPGISRLIGPMNDASVNADLSFLYNQRMIFINTPLDPEFLNKTNRFEAELVALIIYELMNLYKSNDTDIQSDTIGVITPFRAQITQIISTMNQFNISSENISVDTVERYQGSARDRIIISLATNDRTLLDSMSNISQEGVDRKLNVALTRARDQLIVIGNRNLLESKKVYRSLISQSFCIDYKELNAQINNLKYVSGN